jgi:hypothetical protein
MDYGIIIFSIWCPTGNYNYISGWMKYFINILLLLSLFARASFSQSDSTAKAWKFSGEICSYILKDDFFLLPVLTANKNKLHLESRYNYENMKTLSLFAGYNFEFGKELAVTVTPMFGGTLGDTYALVPAMEFEISYKKLRLYSEQEYLFDLNGKEGNFYYTWSELTFAPKDWIWFGISVQRTKLYQTDLDIQRGVLAGFKIKDFSFGAYLFNPGSDDMFGIIFVNYDF